MESAKLEQSKPITQLEVEDHNNVETDAVHPRFQSRAHRLFSCPNCGITKPTEERIQRHFLKKSCFPVYSACIKCGGPVFHYKFGPTQTRLSHDCAKWADHLKRHAKDGVSWESVSLADSQGTCDTEDTHVP